MINSFLLIYENNVVTRKNSVAILLDIQGPESVEC